MYVGVRDDGLRLDDAVASPPARSSVLVGWLSLLRRRWRLGALAATAVAFPVAAYAALAVPEYTAEGVLQVSSQGDPLNPLLELAGAGAGNDVETEVEIIRRRDFVLRALKRLRLDLTDPAQPRVASTHLDIAWGNRSPVTQSLRRAREALATLQVRPSAVGRIPLVLTGLPGERVRVELGPPEAPRVYEVGLGDLVEDEQVALAFESCPIGEDELVRLEILGDGELVDTVAANLAVSSIGSARQPTNLVEIRFTDPDRETARAVVQTLMEQYLDQSLRWQSAAASSSAEFIAQRLEEARAELSQQEETLRDFAQQERAVQLDVQAEVTIRESAELQAQRREIDLQERVIGTVLSGLRRRKAGSAHLTANFFEDPVLAVAVGTLTEAETKYEVLRATLTDDHPHVIATDKQLSRHRREVQRLLESARGTLAKRRELLDARIDESMDSLSTYPDKEMQLARHMRDVEVNQRLYSFLLEKLQEAEILEASTTIDKRIVDPAAYPHRASSPQRTGLVLSGLLGGLAFGCLTVYGAHLLQRRLPTVEAIQEAIPFAVYGTVPAIGRVRTDRRRAAPRDPVARIQPAVVWDDAHGAAAESFRALAVNVSLSPKAPDRGRIVQITSSQPGEGKSTVTSNLAIALALGGARVVLVDLDLRKPVQHRTFGIRRTPGYCDLFARGGGAERFLGALQRSRSHGLDILTAGARLPDTLGALMGTPLDSMLRHFASHYDYVIVDSPPVFVAGTPVIARHADLVLVVARPAVTERVATRHAIESLARSNARRGLVINGVGRDHAESYYYGGGYAYARAYAEASDEDRQATS